MDPKASHSHLENDLDYLQLQGGNTVPFENKLLNKWNLLLQIAPYFFRKSIESKPQRNTPKYKKQLLVSSLFVLQEFQIEGLTLECYLQILITFNKYDGYLMAIAINFGYIIFTNNILKCALINSVKKYIVTV